MKNTMEYKGYIGTVEFSQEDRVFFGKVQGIKALVSYEATDAAGLIEDFHTAVEDYLQLCAEEGKVPEKAYKGSFNVRISPDLHKKIAEYALNNDMTLNKFVEQALLKAIQF